MSSTTYVRAARVDNTKLDAALLIEILEGAKEGLLTHLHDEIEHLSDSHCVLEMMDASRKYALKHGDPFVELPFTMGPTPPEYKIWPPRPWMVAKVILPWVIARRHRGWWKYAPYSMS
ncbi:hypothetical protein V1515DRAFT_628317 [Lipomyces mesembrius]